MSKTVYWIDDSVNKLLKLMDGIITDLWRVDIDENEKKIVSKILMFGDESSEEYDGKRASIEDEHYLQRRLELALREACFAKMDICPKTNFLSENRWLLQKGVRVLFKKLTEQEVEHLSEKEKVDLEKKRKNEEDFFKEIEKYWKFDNREDVPDDVWESESGVVVAKLIELMNIEEGACVGIDVALLSKDRICVLEMNKPVIAMELFHQLSERHCCFLYSSYTYEKDLVPKCKEVYKKHYDEECCIFRREEIMLKRQTDMVKEHIEKWFDDKEKR